MQLKIFDISIVKAWAASSGDFIAACKGPGAGAPSEDPKVFTKWLVLSMYLLILTHLVNIGYFVVSGGNVVSGVISFVQYAIMAFLQTWIFWYAFAKRDPPCCFCCVVCIEDWKPMHLIMGILLLLSGVMQAVNTVLQLLNLMSLGIAFIAFIVYAVFTVLYCLYALSMCGVGLCLVKIGGKKAGVDIPAAEVGKETA